MTVSQLDGLLKSFNIGPEQRTHIIELMRD